MFNNELIALAIPLLASLTVIFIVFFATNIESPIPEEDRIYKDPIPFLLKPLWPLLNLLALPAQYLPVTYILWLKDRLKRSELIYLFNPEQFFGLQLLSALLFASSAWISFEMLNISHPNYVVLALISPGHYSPLTFRNMTNKKEYILSQVRYAHL